MILEEVRTIKKNGCLRSQCTNCSWKLQRAVLERATDASFFKKKKTLLLQHLIIALHITISRDVGEKFSIIGANLFHYVFKKFYFRKLN